MLITSYGRKLSNFSMIDDWFCLSQPNSADFELLINSELWQYVAPFSKMPIYHILCPFEGKSKDFHEDTYLELVFVGKQNLVDFQVFP